MSRDFGGAADPDRDGLSVVLKTGLGLVPVCGCRHAGLLNRLVHARSVVGRDPAAVAGGTHWLQADGPTMDPVVEELDG